MPRHPPGAGGRRLRRPCLGMRPHGNLPPASLSLAIATPIIAGRSIPNPRSGGALPYVGRPALGGRMCPLSGAVRAGREPRVGRRALGYPPPRARGFCPAVRAPFVRLARSLSLIFAFSAVNPRNTNPKRNHYRLLIVVGACRDPRDIGFAAAFPVGMADARQPQKPAPISAICHACREIDRFAMPLGDIAGNYYRLLTGCGSSFFLKKDRRRKTFLIAERAFWAIAGSYFPCGDIIGYYAPLRYG